jgi:hypothetical protein
MHIWRVSGGFKKLSRKDSSQNTRRPQQRKPQPVIEKVTYQRDTKPRIIHLGTDKVPYPDNPKTFYVYGETLIKNSYSRSVVFGPTAHLRLASTFVFAGIPENELCIAWFDDAYGRWIIRDDPEEHGYYELLITINEPPQVGKNV